MNSRRIIMLLTTLALATACASATAAAHSQKPKEIVVVGSKAPARTVQFRKVAGLGIEVSHIEHDVRIKKIGSLEISK
jgi:hypothetical protein